MAKRRTAAQIQAALKAVERDVAKGLTVADSCRRPRDHGAEILSVAVLLKKAEMKTNPGPPAARPTEPRLELAPPPREKM